MQDEPAITLQPATFRQYGLTKSSDPAWLQSRCPQPDSRLAGMERYAGRRLALTRIRYSPPTANESAEVADRTLASAYQAGHGAFPVWTVVHLFFQNLETTWPTE